MIRNVHEDRELVTYQEQPHIVIYDNDTSDSYDTHWHSAVELLMPLEGNYRSIVNNNTYEVRPMDILFISGGTLHRHVAPPSGRRLFFLIDFSIIAKIDGLSTLMSILGNSVLFTPENAPEIHEKMTSILKTVYKEYYNSPDAEIPMALRREGKTVHIDSMFSELAIYSLVMELLTLIGRYQIHTMSFPFSETMTKQKYISTFMNVCNYVEDHFSEPLTLEEVADQSGFSKYHFERLFKSFAGMPFYKYVNKKRIDFAMQELKNEETSITDIAIRSGFATLSAFIRMFKQSTGCTPSQFRKMSRNDNPQ